MSYIKHRLNLVAKEPLKHFFIINGLYANAFSLLNENVVSAAKPLIL